jgi:hypothetical protein
MDKKTVRRAVLQPVQAMTKSKEIAVAAALQAAVRLHVLGRFAWVAAPIRSMMG